MKQIVIIEDEAVAAQHLQRLLAEVMPDAHIDAVLQSIEETVEYFLQHNTSHKTTSQLVFMDIHLADGPAFRIFDRVEISCPIIFTTAYDQYALQAFKVNSIDYLLKPIDKEKLRHALDKLEHLVENGGWKATDPKLLEPQTYKRTFLIPQSNRLVPLPVDNIACFCLDGGITRALLSTGEAAVAMDIALDTVMEELDPSLFFRANRQYIVHHDAIKVINLWPIGKLALTLNISTPDRIIVSKARVREFKRWYTGN